MIHSWLGILQAGPKQGCERAQDDVEIKQAGECWCHGCSMQWRDSWAVQSMELAARQS